jgi:hypothetical protein
MTEYSAGSQQTTWLSDKEKAFRDAQYGTKDAPNQKQIDKLDLGYAVPGQGEEYSELIPWRNRVIDLNKLSPKHLKAIQE